MKKSTMLRAIVVVLGGVLCASLGWALIALITGRSDLSPHLRAPTSISSTEAPSTKDLGPTVLTEQQLRSAWTYVPAYEALRVGAVLQDNASKIEFLTRAMAPATSLAGVMDATIKFINDNQKLAPAQLRANTVQFIKTQFNVPANKKLLNDVAKQVGMLTSISTPAGYDSYVQRLADMLIDDTIPKAPNTTDYYTIKEIIRAAGAQFQEAHAATIDKKFGGVR